jgi:hypothetical protein
MASYINHSCTCNAYRSFIGDMLVLRAAQDLDVGTELTIWYAFPDPDNPEFLKSWGFVCQCAICQDARQTTATDLTTRNNILQQLERVKERKGYNFSIADYLLQKLENTYMQPARGVPRLSLWRPQMVLADAYRQQGNMDKCLEFATKTLRSLEFVITGADPPSKSTRFTVEKWGLVYADVITAFGWIRTAFFKKKSPENGVRADQYARMAYKLCVGEDATFDSAHER